jgi:S-adenosylhomocysteine hydrolase
MNKLPAIEFAKTLLPYSLEKIGIIAVQHLLETTHVMFRAWFDLGLRPENLHVLGKCYSTNAEVAAAMREDGIRVSEMSARFDSHLSYDEQFDQMVDRFLRETGWRGVARVIVLDDGGHLLTRIKDPEMIGIEQTSSGLAKLDHLPFPVINIAKSKAKMCHEPRMVAELVVRRLGENLSAKNILIIGNGSLGQAVLAALKHPRVISYDKRDKGDLDRLLPSADLIIGCTGSTSIPFSKHALLKKGCILASASSSDREFDGVHLRKKIPSYFHCHRDVQVGDVTLLNSGFPVNFIGERHSVAPGQIQLVRGLITLGVLQAAGMKGERRGMVELDEEGQAALEQAFRHYTF